MTKITSALMLGVGLATYGAAAQAEDVTLTIESWRNDDIAIWKQTIIPAFEATHPGIKLVFSPTAPTEYNSALNAKLDAGTAGDVVACRAFDASLALFKAGKLADLTKLPGMENFSQIAKAGWSTDDGAQTYCVPMASVLHGFIYNKKIFKELGVVPPTTEAEFFALLDKIKASGQYVPLVMGTKDLWEASYMGYQNIGPAYWHGEEGRKGLISGSEKMTDPAWVKPLEVLAKWKPYLGDGFEAQTYPDSQNLFTLGRGAIYPSGSWEITGFRSQADFDLGAFPPPVPAAGDKCYINDHPDIGMGLNAASPHAAEAKVFLSWVASSDFANLYANALPGFFSLNSTPVALKDPLAQEFASWREKCSPTIRFTHQVLSRGTPNLDNETWVESANVVNGTETPAQAAAKMQAGLDSWYKPTAK